MPRRAKMVRSALLVLLLGAAVALLLDFGGVWDDARLEGERDAVVEGSGAMLAGERPEAGETTPTLAGRPTPESEPVERGPVTVTVIGPTGEPLTDVVVEARGPGAGTVAEHDADGSVWITTAAIEASGSGDIRFATPSGESRSVLVDRDGCAVFSDLPYDGSWSVTIHGEHGALQLQVFVLSGGSMRLQRRAPPVAVRGPEVVLRLNRGLPLVLQTVDAETGRALSLGAGWSAKPRFGRPPDLAAQPETAARVVAVQPGTAVRIDVGLPAARDHVAWDVHAWDVWIAPTTSDLVAVYPQRPKAFVTLGFPDAHPLGHRKSYRPQVRVAGRECATTIESTSYNAWLLDGVPFVPGERVEVSGLFEKRWTASGTGRLAARVREQVHVPIDTFVDRPVAEKARLQREFRIALGDITGLGAGITDVILMTDASGNLVPPPQEDTDPTRGRVTFLVRRPDGKPAAGALVYREQESRTVGAEGLATFGNVVEGTHGFRIWGAGAAFTADVEVTAGKTATAELTAPRGGAIDVEVVDEEGVPMPFAVVSVKQATELPWVDVDGGTQRVDPFVDHRGRRMLSGVSAGEATIGATLGSRTGTVSVEVREGRTVSARVVLAPVKAPAAKEESK